MPQRVAASGAMARGLPAASARACLIKMSLVHRASHAARDATSSRVLGLRCLVAGACAGAPRTRGGADPHCGFASRGLRAASASRPGLPCTSAVHLTTDDVLVSTAVRADRALVSPWAWAGSMTARASFRCLCTFRCSGGPDHFLNPAALPFARLQTSPSLATIATWRCGLALHPYLSRHLHLSVLADDGYSLSPQPVCRSSPRPPPATLRDAGRSISSRRVFTPSS